MKPIEVDREVKDLIINYHVYGAEVLLNALVRAAVNEPYLRQEDLVRILIHAVRRQTESPLLVEANNRGREEYV